MVRIRHLVKEDIDTVLSWQEGTNADDLYQWAGPGYKYPLTSLQIEKRLTSGEANGAESTTFIYAVEASATGMLIGITELSLTDEERGNASIARVLIGDKASRGKGYGQSALTKIIDIAFAELSVNKLFLKVFDFNINAIKCYENLGFEKVRYDENVYESAQGFWHCYYMMLGKERWHRNPQF